MGFTTGSRFIFVLYPIYSPHVTKWRCMNFSLLQPHHPVGLHLLKQNFMKYFLIILFPLSQLLSDLPHCPTHPTSCQFFLSKTSKLKLRKPSRNRQNPVKQKSIKKMKRTLKTWNPFCVGQRLVGTGLPWIMIHVSNETPLEKTRFPFTIRYQNCKQLLLRRDNLCPFPFLIAGNFWIEPLQSL